VVAVAILSFVALTLVWSCTAKLQFPRQASANAGAHFPRLGSSVAVATLGVLEGVVGVGIMAAVLARSGAAVAVATMAAVVLSVAFGVALLRSYQRGVRVPCGCFGVAPQGSTLTKAHVLRPFALAAAAVAGTGLFAASVPTDTAATQGLAVAASCCLGVLVYEVATSFRAARIVEDAAHQLNAEAA
jgi:hypothetical protein